MSPTATSWNLACLSWLDFILPCWQATQLARSGRVRERQVRRSRPRKSLAGDDPVVAWGVLLYDRRNLVICCCGVQAGSGRISHRRLQSILESLDEPFCQTIRWWMVWGHQYSLNTILLQEFTVLHRLERRSIVADYLGWEALQVAPTVVVFIGPNISGHLEWASTRTR